MNSELVRGYFAIREEIDREKERMSVLMKKSARMEQMIVDSMIDEKITKTTIRGKTMYLRALSTYKVPKGGDRKKQLYEDIKTAVGQETLDELLTINSQSLNRFMREEKERDAQFTLPSLAEPTSFMKLGLRNA